MGDEQTRKFQPKSSSAIENQIFISLADNSTEFFGISDLELRPIYVNAAGLRRGGLALSR